MLMEVPLTPRGFPEEGNTGFPGAGERTNYVASDFNKDGLSLNKKTKITTDDGKEIDLEIDQKVFIIHPGKLFRGRDINVKPDAGVFTLAGLESPNEADALGYIPVSAITKPAGKQQTRMHTGASSQEVVAAKVVELFGTDRVSPVSTAKTGSTVADVILKIDRATVQFEVKGTRSTTGPITFFDRSMRRGTRNELLDDFAKILSNGESKNFTELVDSYREKDQTIGFPGDEGVGKSGKLPSEFRVTDSALLSKFRKELLDHFKDGNDNYFVIHNRTSDEVDIYHTGHKSNPLKAPILPDLKQFDVRTYGGPSAGAMRVGLKIKLGK